MQAKEQNKFTSLQSSTAPEWSPNFPLQAALQGKIKTYGNDICTLGNCLLPVKIRTNLICLACNITTTSFTMVIKFNNDKIQKNS